jgi:hypothetical protein
MIGRKRMFYAEIIAQIPAAFHEHSLLASGQSPLPVVFTGVADDQES